MPEDNPSLDSTESSNPIHLDSTQPAVMRFFDWLLSHPSTEELTPEDRVGKLIDDLGTIDAELGPLMALRTQIQKFLGQGTRSASVAFVELYVAVTNGRSQVDVETALARMSLLDRSFPWNSSKLATALVLVHAAPQNKVFNALKFQSELLGGLPNLAQIRSVPSASFDAAFQKAKDHAVGQEQATTVIGVSLADVNTMERAENGTDLSYTSFAHDFVTCIGPEGFIIWQAWGPRGYGLDEYVTDGKDKVHTWDEAAFFVHNFSKMVKRTGPWTAKINKLYKRCFDVDMINLCSANGPLLPIVPKFEAWVRLHVIEDVKAEYVGKFAWRKVD